LQEELIDTLEVGPSRVYFILLLDTGLRKTKVGFLYVRKGSENVLFDHLHDLIEVRDDQSGYILLVT
jgi:hypothetical protein